MKSRFTIEDDYLENPLAASLERLPSFSFLDGKPPLGYDTKYYKRTEFCNYG